MLVPLDENFDGVEVSLAYATKNNFTGRHVYREELSQTYINEKTADLFKTAIKQAQKLGFYFKVWDAFRPLEAQQILWDHTPDERYVSHPQTGNRPHCRGGALDLTLVNSVSGQSLAMGTAFDDFSTKAHQGCLAINESAQENRMLLVGIMHSAGFVCNPFEWWHFELADLDSYPVLSDSDSPVPMMPK